MIFNISKKDFSFKRRTSISWMQLLKKLKNNKKLIINYYIFLFQNHCGKEYWVLHNSENMEHI